ncbi:MAG: hypothetical protein A3B82_00735 [Methylophilales bacterium RIFCSPHIGHO2_02_FULL_57_10]|nr:MAG: hypothetical protein A3B82_00735 [Methylophilales bacterium RIFCSPHIGHO2_02_FULL_57_10]
MLKRFLENWYAIQARERQHVLAEMEQVRGLLPLLMRHRNGETWTPEDRVKLMQELRSLAGLSPYLLPVLLPGGILFLPLLAWWLDRRRTQRGIS